MSKGGGNSTVTQEIDPQVKSAYLTNLDYARDVSNQLGERQFAGYNPQYTAGEQQIMSAAQGGQGMQNLDTAANLTSAAAGYSPMAMQAASAGPAAMVGAAQADMSNIGKYLNPYTQEVIDTSMADLEKSRQRAVQNIGQQATAAKAFGGSRHGVAEAMTSGEYGAQAGQTIARLRQQGFDTAANLMQQDVARQQQANLSNQSAYNQMAQYNASNLQQARGANQAADLSGAQFRLGAAQQLGNLGQQQTAGQYQAGQALMGLGQMRQDQAQKQLDASRNLGMERLGIMQGALGLQPADLGGTRTSPMYNNTGASMLGGALGGAQLAGMLPSLGLSAGAGAGVGALMGLI